ncbi:hypothetical protein J2X32_003126 [Rheinheimera pacifica]|uniref:hypothetical protein n=1 Tax=Rheinheimera pacifica TaxID=173990 RepID=UPI002854A061|nr:hypothetical protein [Rheinheimera pacifica]MDR6984482.1 hypothetical protein [Rheinheimera pacifica]
MILLSPTIMAGEWVTLEPENLLQYEIIQQNAFSYANEGLYIKHKTKFTTALACAKKEFVVFTEPKMIDRALSSLMFAISSNKTMRFYVTGCDNEYIHAKVLMFVL